MRPLSLLLPLGAMLLSGCLGLGSGKVSPDLIDENNLSEVMLTLAEPKEALAYFQKAAAEKPDRIDLQRGLAKAMMRAGNPSGAVRTYQEILTRPQSGPQDQLGLAEAHIRANDWPAAESLLKALPADVKTFDRYRLEAMVADSHKDWPKADRHYDTAVGLTTRPAGVLNNWGFSKLARKDAAGAERLFLESLSYNAKSFTTKNNLVMARAMQRKYDLPMIEMTQTERAQLLHTIALAAIKGGDTATGRSLLQDALDSHPQHFEAAARDLRTLNGGRR